MESLLSSGAGSLLEVWVERTAACGPIVDQLILLLLGTGPLWHPMADTAMCSQPPPPPGGHTIPPYPVDRESCLPVPSASFPWNEELQSKVQLCYSQILLYTETLICGGRGWGANVPLSYGFLINLTFPTGKEGGQFQLILVGFKVSRT